MKSIRERMCTRSVSSLINCSPARCLTTSINEQFILRLKSFRRKSHPNCPSTIRISAETSKPSSPRRWKRESQDAISPRLTSPPTSGDISKISRSPPGRRRRYTLCESFRAGIRRWCRRSRRLSLHWSRASQSPPLRPSAPERRIRGQAIRTLRHFQCRRRKEAARPGRRQRPCRQDGQHRQPDTHRRQIRFG